MTILTEDIDLGVEALRQGRLVAFPTETVYGLGADAANPQAVTSIFTAKGRPSGHPLIAHLASVDQIDQWARLDGETATMVKALADAFWPGPLTLVVPRTSRVADETVGGRATIGLRVPDHPVALQLLAGFGSAVAAPSANRFGRVSPTTAAHVVEDLDGLVDVVIDGGSTAVGIESTIVELVGPNPTLLRPGAVSSAEVAEAIGRDVADGATGESRAPGMLQSHYAPKATIELVEAATLADRLASSPQPDTVVGVIAPLRVDQQPAWHLPADAAGYAARLYESLREADRMGVGHLLVVPPSEGAMVAAVLDRLTKAAAPRS